MDILPTEPDSNEIFPGVIISAGSNSQQKNNLIDVSQTVDQQEIPRYQNSKTVQHFTVVHDKVKSQERPTNRSNDSNEEAKIQIYAMTGIVSCMLLVILFAFTYFMVQKRKERRSQILKTLNVPTEEIQGEH